MTREGTKYLENMDSDMKREKKTNPVRYSAILALFDPAGRILLVRTQRLPHFWQPVGGGIEYGDKSPMDALLREIKEEISLELVPEDLEYQLCTNYDLGIGKIYCYAASLPPERSIFFCSSEIIEGRWFKMNDTLSLPMLPAGRKFVLHLLQTEIEDSRSDKSLKRQS